MKTVWCLAALLGLIAGGASALHPAMGQGANTRLDAARTNAVEIRAATLLPILRGRPVHAADGWRIGRVTDLRVTDDGNGILAFVRRRPLLGGGRVAFRVGLLRDIGSRLVAPASRAQVRTMRRL